MNFNFWPSFVEPLLLYYWLNAKFRFRPLFIYLLKEKWKLSFGSCTVYGRIRVSTVGIVGQSFASPSVSNWATEGIQNLGPRLRVQDSLFRFKLGLNFQSNGMANICIKWSTSWNHATGWDSWGKKKNENKNS